MEEGHTPKEDDATTAPSLNPGAPGNFFFEFYDSSSGEVAKSLSTH
jgi:hypothetical protein